MPQAWLARFGRTVADQVLDAVDGRMTAPAVAGTRVTLAGWRIGGAAEADGLERREAESERMSAWGVVGSRQPLRGREAA